MKFFFWIIVDVVTLLIDVALKAGLGLLFTAPKKFVWMNLLRGRHCQPFFEKILLTYLRGKGDVGHPNYLYEINLIEKWRNEIIPRSEGNKGGRGEPMHFLHSCCISFGVRINFFSLGINNKFVIANSFPCIFTSDRGIIFDLRRYFFVRISSWSGSMSHLQLVTTTGLCHVTWTWKKVHVDNRQVVFGIFWRLSLS